jgi:hypothetical protein
MTPPARTSINASRTREANELPGRELRRNRRWAIP